MKFLLILMWVAICNAATVSASGLQDVIATDAKVEKLADGFKFTEGATVNAEGEIFFTDQPNDAIYRWTPESGVRLFMQPAGRSNGMCFMRDGSLLACADEKMELWKIAPDGSKTVLANSYQNKPLNGPNDVWVHPDGGCYFTDPFYKRPWWEHDEPPQGTQQVYYLPAGAQQPIRVTEDLTQPNGIVGTVDGKQLFVADIRAKIIWKYRIAADYTLADKQLFCNMGSDGMTIDSDGRVYLTGKEGVYVFDKNGVQLGVIEIPETWSANVCIGGVDKRTLFVTSRGAVYAVRLKVKGTPQAK